MYLITECDYVMIVGEQCYSTAIKQIACAAEQQSVVSLFAATLGTSQLSWLVPKLVPTCQACLHNGVSLT